MKIGATLLVIRTMQIKAEFKKKIKQNSISLHTTQTGKIKKTGNTKH